jgi:riboflavin synthase
MFTGIIESVGQILEIVDEGANRHFRIGSDLSSELKVDQSLAHEGVCLTVTKCDETSHWVTAIDETLKKSNVGAWTPNRFVNLERCMKADGRFDGHIVQGHVDTIARVKSIQSQDGSWLFTFEVDSTDLIVEKGSVCLNGTSLTCFNVTSNSFSVAIIPYTYEHTTFGKLKPEDQVNIEFDILGKYIQKMIS